MIKRLKATMGVLVINTICTLKCKNCITFTPYHLRGQNYEAKNIEHEINSFFNIYESVDHFDLEGGETLLHPSLPEIIQTALQYKAQFKTLNILTNGTLLLSDKVIEACKKEPVFFIIDDYGDLSSKKEALIEQLKANQIEYRVDTYHGDSQYFDGWIDFGDLTFKNYSEDEVKEVFKNCRSGNCGAPYVKNGKMYLCPIQSVEAEHIELVKGEYVDLNDATEALEEKINIASKFALQPINSCKFCKGFNVSSDRVSAAIQLSEGEGSDHRKFVKN